MPRILAEPPLPPEKVKYYLERRDPEFEPKMRQVLVIYREVALQNQQSGSPLASNVVTVSVDEKPGVQAIANTAPGSASARQTSAHRPRSRV